MMAAPDAKAAAAICFDTINLEEDRYRLGHTKLFFRTGVVAYLEELREEKIQFMMRSVQAQCRTYLAKKRFKKMVDQRLGFFWWNFRIQLMFSIFMKEWNCGTSTRHSLIFEHATLALVEIMELFEAFAMCRCG